MGLCKQPLPMLHRRPPQFCSPSTPRSLARTRAASSGGICPGTTGSFSAISGPDFSARIKACKIFFA